MAEAFSHTDLGLLFLEFGLKDYDLGSGPNRKERSLTFIRAVQAANADHAEAERVLLDVARRVLELPSFPLKERQRTADELRASLSVDGFEYSDGRLIPSTPSPAALGPEISAMESDLQGLGWTVAGGHYRQATDNFVLQNSAACNSQVRSFLEDLFIAICRQLCSREFPDAGAALQHLRDRGLLDIKEYNMFRSFWDEVQSGAHHGLSDDQEALFRLQVATAIGRYMVRKAQGHASL
jgi:hypothetical protein